MAAQHLECLLAVDRVAGHQDALRLLDHSAAAKRSLQAVVLGEALQRDVDRARQLLGIVVEDVREDAPLGRLVDVRRVLGREQRDHRTRGLADDLPDQVERVLRVQPEPDERDVGPFSRRHRPDLLDVDLARDHLVPEPGDDLREQREPVAALVRDQHPEVSDVGLGQLARHPGRILDFSARPALIHWGDGASTIGSAEQRSRAQEAVPASSTLSNRVGGLSAVHRVGAATRMRGGSRWRCESSSRRADMRAGLPSG